VISSAEYDELLEAVVSQRDHVEIARRLVDLTLEPATQRLEHFAEQARLLAKRLAKGEVEVDVAGDGVRLERERFAEFWSSFSHVIRNAVDHGLEAPETRAELGKPAGGSLRLATRDDGQDFVIEVSDDGRGIDWERVREKAAALGLPTGDRRDLVEALFAPGLTTASEVSETSGRGIGLSAVREACSRLGGSIEVESDKGRGTSIRFRFPSNVRAAYPAPRVQRAA
jgi:two-component system chemotaxis sensor kinase CheA